MNWKAVEGAAVKKRILRLAPDPDGVFVCPVSTCLHSGFKSARGLRKHINSVHDWFLYFDQRPKICRDEAVKLPKKKLKASTHKMSAFKMDGGVGKEFLEWLKTPCGSGKTENEAVQVGRRAMKFLFSAMGESSADGIVQEDYVDCCIGSPSIIINFLKVITEDWGLSSSGALNYLKSIGDLMDFRKACGVSDDVLRSFASSEVYIRRGKENLSKQKKIDYRRNLTLESLIARNSWASVPEMESVIPYHSPRFQHLLKKAVSKEHLSINDLAFTTRFIVTFLFLRVKSTRPMTFKMLTLPMMQSARVNGGYIDASQFKTEETYGFDTVVLSGDAQTVIDKYIQYFRPLMNPKCEYLLVTTNGTQYTALGTAMTYLVHQAIGKFVNPTVYRMILETESAAKLTPEESATVSRDQKHSSQVAKRIYQRLDSRAVAVEGASCMKKLLGDNRDSHTTAMAASLDETVSILVDDDTADITGDVPADADAILTISADLTEAMDRESTRDNAIDDEELSRGNAAAEGESSRDNVTADGQSSRDNAEEVAEEVEEVNADSITEVINVADSIKEVINVADSLNELELKKEEVDQQLHGVIRAMRFTSAEDEALKVGIKKHGIGKWASIVGDSSLKFHPSRNRDSLRMRAGTLGLTKKGSSLRKKKKHVP